MDKPTKRTVAGVELVTIPLADYAELLDCQRRLAELRAVQSGLKRSSRSPIEHDPEVATFIANRLGLMTFSEIQQACVAEFGPERAPSRAAIHRRSIRVTARLRTVAEKLGSWTSHEPPDNPA